ncbi:MAG: long-chain-fatty-acid--CoA ligase [Gammaproteobacteria bacterium]|nr:long-chain-fatty-acid--CoA ligase [Gammaproteobacteria bacterium]|tara:strand:- start:520 stop:2166 length:1647 start_codon:yes stop_codon:yes gene_type:complete
MKNLWLKNYPPQVRHNIDELKYDSLSDLMVNTSKIYGNKIAFTNLKTKISYKKHIELSKVFASNLQKKCNVRKGDKIAIMLPNLLTYPVALLGSYLAGAIIVNINPLYKSREIEDALKDSGAETIIVLDIFLSELNEVISKTKIQNVIVCKVTDLLNPIMKIVVGLVMLIKNRKISIEKEYLPFSKMLKKETNLLEIKLTHDDIALLQYTGGTTGKSKAAVLTHRNILSNILQLDSWVEHIIKKGNESIITALPLYHIFSFTVNLMYFYSIGSNNILVTNPRNIKDFVKILKNNKFTVITAVNTLFNLLLNSSNFKKLDFSNLKFSVGGGMSVLSSTASKWKSVTGVEITQGYGLTETSPIVSINKIKDAYNGTIGLPVPSTDISIRNDNGEELSIDQEGELCIKGPQVMTGYYNNIQETEKSFTDDGFFKTGDIATVNSEGFIKIVDRKKDMIISSGYNVYPNEIEDYVSQHHDVRECGVIGKPDLNRGESIILYVVRSNYSLSENDIISFCKNGLTEYKIPKKVKFIEEIPKNNVGKILRRKLREL